VGQQLPPGTAAEENEAKIRRRDKRRLAGELGEGGKRFNVAEGEEELWDVFSVCMSVTACDKYGSEWQHK